MRNSVLLIAIFGMGLLAISPARAADTQPGDACTTTNQVMITGGSESGGVRDFMICNGGTWLSTLRMSPSGRIGVGQAAPAAPLHVNGEGIFASNGLSCAGTTAGGIRFNSAATAYQYCDGATWLTFSSAGGGGAIAIDDLTDAIVQSGNMYLGQYVGAYSTGTGNVAMGVSAMQSSGTGSNNTALGVWGMNSLSNGSYNTGIGYQALSKIKDGNNNTALGYGAGLRNVAGAELTALGYGAMQNANSAATAFVTYNTAVGAYALQGSGTPSANTGTVNTAIGHSAMAVNTSGSNNTAVGTLALQGNTTGSYNNALGESALSAATSGSYNVAMGNLALFSLSSGNNNTAIGYRAGFAGTAITTGTNNTFLGYQAGSNGAAYTNGMALGNSAVLTASNRIVLGNASIASIYAQVTSITAISDRRHKKDIEPLNLGLDFIRNLKPVKYRFNNGDETLRYGFIAQDLESALSPDLRSIVEKVDSEHSLALLQKENNKEGTYRVNYGELTSPIVKAIQEQQQIIDRQRQVIESQDEQLRRLSRRVNEIERKLQTLH